MNLDSRLFRRVRAAAAAFGITVVLGIAGGILVIIQSLQLSRIISDVFLGHAGLNQIRPGLILLLVVIGVRAVTAFGSELSAAALAVKVKTHLRSLLVQKIAALGPAYTQSEPGGKLTAVVIEAVEALDAYFSQYLPQLLLAVFIPLSILIVVFPLDLLSGIVLLVTAPLIPIFMFLIGSAAETLTKRQWVSLSRMSAHFLDTLQGLRTLKALGRSGEQDSRIFTVSEQYRNATLMVLRVTFLSALVLELVATLSTAVVAVEIGLRLLYGKIGFEQAFFILLIAPEFYLPLRTLGLRFHAGLSGMTAAKQIFEILDVPEPSVFAAVDEPKRTEEPKSVLVEFKNVTYAYPLRSLPAVNDIQFSLWRGKLTALAGASGAGKSTLASLLLRFITAQSGTIEFEGQPLFSIPLSEWRKQTAWVPQQPHLFHGSLLDNIRLGKPNASMEEVRGAARMAQLDDFIQTLPDGYQTLMGEQGAKISGGQAQRIAIARAFLMDAPLLILDEPTAHLDPEQEEILRLVTKRLLVNRTVLLIAHRLSSVREADQVLVMREGRIVERGRPTELMAQGGYYRQLVEAYQEVR